MKTAVRPPARLTSIIVPCFNQLVYTRRCVAALMRHTRRPWELIVVDNGSNDGTSTYLQGVGDAAPVRVAVIENSANLGFPAACNQALRIARGDNLVLLNNDAVVTDAWLDLLVALAESDPAIGMVGPMSNYAAPPQLVERVDYRDLGEMDRFAVRWREEHRGRWFTVERLVGFCLLIKRGVVEAIGGLDERFGLGLFDDDDLALRARRAGFKLAVAQDLFVHHYGSRTFAGSGVDTEALLRENHSRFAAKWGEPASGRQAVSLRPWSEARPARVPSTKARVSLTMIVRDEEANLPACLESSAGIFDEIVVVDTGSADRTAEIARDFGARVVDFAWVDDFAAARNVALAHASGDYAFWLDADDRIGPVDRERLRALLQGLDARDGAAFVLRCVCDPELNGRDGTIVDHIRLFPRRDDVRWAYRVHEQVLPALRRAGVEIRWSDVEIRHVGYVDPATRRRKLDRDRRLLEMELAERPGDPFVLFNLGWIAVERKEPGVALPLLRASLEASGPTDSIVRKLHALIAQAHQALGQADEALAACSVGLAACPNDPELLFREAIVRRIAGDREGAEDCWRRVLLGGGRRVLSSVSAGLSGHLTRRNLALLVEERGDLRGAARLWREVLAECPGDRDALSALRRLGCGRSSDGVRAGVPSPDATSDDRADSLAP
jgi:GT2 family glycosyltransferase